MAISCSTSICCNSPLESALGKVKELGFEHVDLLAIEGWAHVDPSRLADGGDEAIRELMNTLQSHGLRLLALNTGTGPQLHDRSSAACAQRTREIDALIRLMKASGIGIAAIQPRNNDPARSWEDVLRDCIATLEEYHSAAAEAGVVFALELHIGSPFETLEQARRLTAVLPDLRIVYDPSHFVMQGVDIRETEWLMELASHVHIRDAAAGKMQTRFGEGQADFDWMLSRLSAKGYEGHFSIEYLESDEFDTADDVLRARDAILHYFPQARPDC